ncbi:transcription initiation factor IIF, beta subunit-domain-containing protein [Cubamyces menziesii]|nr:transcription initiation factor IIF, beta subunit-domain-containing protein [Cubamyces menziesii]
MSFSALELYEPELHGKYEDWSMDTDTDADDGSSYDSDEAQILTNDGIAYIMKIPKHLMERWTAIDEEGVHLATIRFYHDPRAASTSRASSSSSPATATSASSSPSASISTSTHGPAPLPKTRIVLTLPADSDDPALGPDEYEIETHTADPEEPYNQYVVAQYDSHSRGSEADPGGSATSSSASGTSSSRSAAGSRGGTRALTGHKRKSSGSGSKPAVGTGASARRRRVRRIALAGVVTHHGTLRAVHGERLRQRVKARSVAANTHTRQTILIEHHHASRSVVGGSSKKPFIMTSTKKATKDPADRNVRIPRPKLLDMLFSLFEEKLRWPLKVLRERTQQPEAYLKEVLSEIAYPHRAGEHRGAWELSASYRYRKVRSRIVPKKTQTLTMPTTRSRPVLMLLRTPPSWHRLRRSRKMSRLETMMTKMTGAIWKTSSNIQDRTMIHTQSQKISADVADVQTSA